LRSTPSPLSNGGGRSVPSRAMPVISFGITPQT
jgi:hypothetical protein